MTVEKVMDVKENIDLKDLKQQIESLSMVMKSATIGSVKTKAREEISSPRKEELSGNTAQKGIQGSPKKGKISLGPGQKPIQSYQCEGWGHGW